MDSCVCPSVLLSLLGSLLICRGLRVCWACDTQAASGDGDDEEDDDGDGDGDGDGADDGDDDDADAGRLAGDIEQVIGHGPVDGARSGEDQVRESIHVRQALRRLQLRHPSLGDLPRQSPVR
eukprot:2858500-Rhodomonas_salina.3